MIKKLAGCVREYTLPSLITPVLILGESILEVLIPFYMADLIDLGIDAGDMDFIRSCGIKLIVLAMLSLACGIAAGCMASVASAGFAKNLMHDMYHRIQRFSFANIDKFSTGGLVTRLTTDVTNVQMAFQMALRGLVRSPSLIVFALIMAFRINTTLPLVFICAIPVLGVGIFLIFRNAHPLFVRVFKIYDRLNSVVQENLRGIRVVKAFIREDHETEKFMDVSGDMYRTNLRAEYIMACLAPLMQFAMYACMLLIAWIGARLIVSGSMTSGKLMSFLSYVMQILISLMFLSMIIMMSVIASAAARRICEVLDEEPDIKDPEGDAVTELADGSIRFERVSFGYSKDTDCLTDIDLEIRSGETIGIIGGTGSGKSSLVQLIPRLYDVTAGRVLVGGADVRGYDLFALRSGVAMVLQKNVLFSGTVRENLLWGNKDASDEDLVRACVIAQADGFIRQMPDGYDSRIEQGGTNVSGGQRQRLCIARAIVGSPRILILDDSTSAVDTATDALIRKGFREMLPETTKLIIAQRISSIQDADRIIVLNEGRVDGFGTHEELMASNQIYREVCEAQTRDGDFDA